MRKLFKKITALVLATVMAGSLAACGGGGDNNTGGTSNEGKSLDTDAVVTFGLASAWDTLNIYSSNGGSFSTLIADKIFDRLVYVGESFEVEPRGAQSWEIDGNTLTFHLDPNAKWHDGTKVTAQDWVFTLQYVSTSDVALISRGFASKVEGTSAGGIEESENSINVEAADEDTLVIHLKEAYNMDSFMMTYARNLFVLPSHILGELSDEEIMNSDFWENPIGSGPCVYDSQVSGSELTLNAYGDYQLGKPQFDKLVFKVVAASNFANALMSGEIDITYTHMDTDSALSLQGADGITVTKQEQPTFLQLLGFGCTIVPESIRHAVNLAIDKETIVNNFYAGQGELVETVILPGSEYYVDDEGKGQNIEEAKKYLQAAIEAGEWSADRVFEIGVNTDARRSQAELIVQWLEEVGITAKVSMFDSATMWSKLMSNELDSCMMGLMPSNDPLSLAATYVPATSNFFHVDNEDFAALVGQIEVEQDLETRKELVKQFIELEAQEIPISWICAQYSFAVTSSRLEADPFASDMMNNAVWKWKVYER